MDDFREWLSDNLRYFMLGGAILLVVLVLVFSIRACTGTKKGSSDLSETPVSEQTGNTAETENTDSADSSSNGSNTEAGGLSTANADITALVTKYYTACQNADISTLQDITVDFSPANESKVKNDAQQIEKYDLTGIYSKDGLTDGAYVVYVTYNIVYDGYNTPVPMLSQMYVVTEEGALKILQNASSDSSISALFKQLGTAPDVQELTTKVKNSYNQALADDENLSAFLSDIGEEVLPGSTSESDSSSEESTPSGPTVVTNDYSNLRESADGNSEVLDVVPEGTEVEKLGEEELWVKVRYNGTEGYIYYELVD